MKNRERKRPTTSFVPDTNTMDAGDGVAAQGCFSPLFKAALWLGGLVAGTWLAAGILALGGAAISGDLSQGDLDPLLIYHFLGTYCVLGLYRDFLT